MSTLVRRDDVIHLLDQGAQLVEVLDSQEYRNQHLPGAINIPLENIEREAQSRLRRERPVVVYCYDRQ